MQPDLCRRAVLLGALALLSTGAEAPPAAVMPLSEVEPGLRGLGWSVFSGHEPEPFDVEVLGVWRMINPDSSYILARLSGRGLEESGVVAGMSGSPVYVGDRLLGAVSFSWLFASDAIAGVTPIESMREMTSAAASPARPAAGGGLEMLDLVRPPRGRESLVAGLSRLAGSARGAGGLLWGGTGFGGEAESLLREAVGPVVAAGASPRLESDLEPGDAVAAVLIDGDFRLAATGTVTDRLGDVVLAFGHPFLSLGDVAVPMAGAEIITVVPSLANSFKIGNIGPTLGSFDRDRPAGVRGVVGALPAMLPLAIRVVGERERSFELELARIPQLAGPLVAVSLLGAIDAAAGAGGEQELDVATRIALAGRETVEMRQRFDGDNAATEAAIQVLGVFGFLANNELAEVEVTSIEIEVAQRRGNRRATRVTAAHPDRRVVAPGASVALSVELDPYQEAPRRHRLQITLPEDLEDGPYILLVGDGTSLDAARLELEKFAPARIEQALDFLAGLHSREQLGVLGVAPAPGLAVGGKALTRLPGSIREIWAAGPKSGAVELRTTVRQQVLESLDIPLEGLVRVDLEIRARGRG